MDPNESYVQCSLLLLLGAAEILRTASNWSNWATYSLMMLFFSSWLLTNYKMPELETWLASEVW